MRFDLRVMGSIRLAHPTRAERARDFVGAEPLGGLKVHWRIVGAGRRRGIDLYCASHTHGVQVAIPFYGALVTFSRFGKEYESGLFHEAGTTLYVNRGIGMEGGPVPRVRFWARPEITVFDLVPKGQPVTTR